MSKNKSPIKKAQTPAVIPPQMLPVTIAESGMDEDVLRSDLIIPYAIVMQGLSDFVKERKAQMGDICRSMTAEKLGDPDHSLNVVFLHKPKEDWVLEQKPPKQEKYVYRKAIPRSAENETLEWDYWSDDEGLIELAANQPGATQWKRVKRLSVFCLLKSDMDAARAEKEKLSRGELPDPNKSLTPVILSFRKTSYTAGKEISTFYTQARSMGVAIWKYMVPMGTTMKTNDNGDSYYVWTPDRTKVKPVSSEDMHDVQTWAAIINSGAKLTVDEEGESLGEARVVNSTDSI